MTPPAVKVYEKRMERKGTTNWRGWRDGWLVEVNHGTSFNVNIYYFTCLKGL